ncbi:MAG: hypothetical protein BRD28_01435 [Bacteroidetes bacterium QH_10_64_37]|jgi:hypothetical protein|nr:MAG: hypothetical protein BRD28_01435 [Bacteroidetes bacterium QH_10_64_37]
MTNRDRDLQDAFDRHLHGDGPRPGTTDDLEAAAYGAVYATLNEEFDLLLNRLRPRHHSLTAL